MKTALKSWEQGLFFREPELVEKKVQAPQHCTGSNIAGLSFQWEK
jgi:hypothetical protein